MAEQEVLGNHTVRPSGITDRKEYVRISSAFHTRYRYRRNSNELLRADAETAALCSLEVAASQIKMISDIVLLSQQIQMQRSINDFL